MNVVVQTNLGAMYTKSGRLKLACHVFKKIPYKRSRVMKTDKI